MIINWWKNLFLFLRPNFKKILLFCTLSIGFGSSIILYFYIESYHKFPQLKKSLPILYKTPNIILLDVNGRVIPYSHKSKKIIVNYDDISKDFITTLINTEDKDFFSHKGISIMSTLRSILMLPIFILLKKRPWGASTITQQLVRNIFLNKKYSYLRKIRELILSFRIEKELTKEEILSLYLNVIYLGKGIYGIGGAAKTFFNKTIKQLNPEEIAFLVAVIKNPMLSGEQYHHLIIDRRNFILEKMVQTQLISKEYYDSVQNQPICFYKEAGNDRSLYGQHFVKEIFNKYKHFIEKNIENNEDLIIHTTMNINIQKILDKTIKDNVQLINDNINQWYGTIYQLSEDKMEAWSVDEKVNFISRYNNLNIYGINFYIGLMNKPNEILLNNKKIVALENYKQFKNDWSIGSIFLVKKLDDKYFAFQKPIIEASGVIMDGNGRVLAMTGSNDYNISDYNRVIETHIQMGSVAKILTVACAINYGLTPETIVEDEPISIPLINDKNWNPRNWDNKFLGSISLKQAAILSRNCGLINGILTIPNWYESCKKFFYILGIKRFQPSFLLGSMEMNLLDFTRIIAMIANGGYKLKENILATKIINEDDILLENSSLPNNPILNENICKEVFNIFESNRLEGLSWSLKIPQGVATKSGTTNQSRRFNFVAFIPKGSLLYPDGLVIFVSIANDNNISLGGNSNKTAGFIVKKILESLIL